MGVQIGSLYVRRSVFIDAQPASVWKEFVDLKHIRTWLGLGQKIHKFELKLESTIELSVEIDGERRYFGGKIICVEDERELSFESQWQSPYEWPVPTLWTIRLTQLYSGTLVELFHHGFERLGKEASDSLQGYEEGWTVRHLKELRLLVRLNEA